MADQHQDPHSKMAGDTAAVPHLAPVAPAPRPEDQVGDLLRCAREKAGKSMRDVSDALNIRFVYVEALEQSDYGKLPGTTYAIGFLRTYAQYLGLDVAELVQRFKEEQAGLDRQTQLVFPTPVPEGKVPGGALILVSVVLVALAYGAWSYFSKDENSVADLVPAVPERLQNLMTEGDSDGDAPADSATASAGESVAAVPSNSSPIFVLPEPHSDSEIKTAEPVEAAAAMPAPESVEAVPETAVQLVAAPAGSDIGPEPAEASTEAPVEDLVEATLAPAPPAEQETSQPEVVSAPGDASGDASGDIGGGGSPARARGGRAAAGTREPGRRQRAAAKRYGERGRADRGPGAPTGCRDHIYSRGPAGRRDPFRIGRGTRRPARRGLGAAGLRRRQHRCQDRPARDAGSLGPGARQR
jgi:cytoskeletal protein RodZ